MSDDNDKLAVSDKDIVAEAKRRLEFCVDADGDNHSQGLSDLQFLSGDQWDPKARRQRDLDGRPCLTVNKLPTFLHQVTNDLRQNVPSIKIHPVGSEDDVEKAEVIQGIIRHSEYSSNADVAYDTAVGSAAAIGFGYFRLVTEYCYPDSFDQDIKFKRIRNAMTVYFDPASEEADGSDAMFCFITTRMPRDEFLREYPESKITTAGFDVGPGDTKLDWISKDFVRLAEYYRVVMKPATLVELTNGETGWKDELLEMPPGVAIKRERQSARRAVEWYKLTALDVLETVEIKCKWIPVFPVYGDELDIEGKVIRSGLIRNAKDPARMYNFWMTAATEEVALRPKTPYIGAEGQFEGYEDEWGDANVRSFPYLEYKQVALDGNLAPPPARQQMADVPTGILAMANHASDNIKATTGLFDSSLGARGNATSGIQEREQQRQGDMANFHYSDNLMRAIRQAGRCFISMIPYYYDADRIVKIMGDDGKMDSAPINQPIPPDQQKPDPKTGAIQAVLNDMSVGEFDVTVSVGPSYSTLRQEAADSMIEFGKSWPKLMDVAGDKVVRSMDWPGAEEIAERIEKTIPPELRGDADESAPMVQTPKGPIPLEQAGQMLAEMDQQIQEMGQQLQEATSGIAKAKVDAESRERVAEINAVSKNDVAELQGLIQILIAKMQPPPQLVAEAFTQGEPAQSAPAAATNSGALQ